MIGVLTSIAFATSVFAQETGSMQIQGRVVDKQPIFTNVSRPVQDCHIENRATNNAAGDALAGMIIGGILGKGITGKDNGAAAGAVIGGMIGANNGANNSSVRQVQVCNTVYQNVSVINEVDIWVEAMGQRFPVRMNATQANNYFVNQRVNLLVRFQLMN